MNAVIASGEQPRVILVIDDMPANVAVVAEYLVDHDFVVLVAQDGEEGLQRARLAKPDLILLDVQMPNMDGFETCRRLKAAEETKDIPVIFMTALSDVERKLAAFEAGGVDYVTKPIHIQEVFARVSTHLNLHCMQRELAARNQELEERNAELKALNEKLSMAQMQLIQSEKLAALGQLTAGIAHEINNPMSFVLSNLRTLEKGVTGVFDMLTAYESAAQAAGLCSAGSVLKVLHERLDIGFLQEDVPVLVKETIDGADRVKRIVQDLRDFSHASCTDTDWEYADLHKNIDATLNIVANEVKYRADIIKEYGAIPDVECLPSQLNQVVMNLVVNAAQAIGKEERGKITIRTGLEDERVWIEIADTGNGIPEENLSRIFDPFFTTKPVGQGTGLGLALSYGIVQKHRGEISVSSEVGKGTRFRIVLPVQQARDQDR